MINQSEALWAAKLHVKTTVKGTPGTILETAMVLAICKALVETEARLQRALDFDHGKGLAVMGIVPHETKHRELGLPPVKWRSFAEPGTMGTPEGEVHAEAQAKARLTCPTGVLVQAPIGPSGEVVYVERPSIEELIGERPFTGSSDLQAIQICACGEQLPHAVACAKTTDPEAIDDVLQFRGADNGAVIELGPGPVCASCNDTHQVESWDHTVQMCTHCPLPCSKCRHGGIGAFCSKTPCACECHAKKAAS